MPHQPMTKTSLLLLTSIALWLCMACSGRESGESEESEIAQNPEMEENHYNEPRKLDYLALGDSYTIGEGVPEELRWPNQLAERLSEFDIDLSPVDIIATTGWTTRQLLDGIEAADPERHGLVSLLIGVNNQYRKQPFELYEREFGELLGIAIELAGGKQNVFVVSIPDYGVTPFGSGDPEGIGKEIDRYNTHARKTCEEQGIPFVDITGISRELGDSPGALAADRLHPSGSQYTRWTEAILPVALELIRNRP